MRRAGARHPVVVNDAGQVALAFVGQRDQKKAAVSAACLRLLSARSAVASLAAAVIIWPSSSRADEPVPPVGYDPAAFPPPHARGSLLLLGAATTTAWYSLALVPSLIWRDFPGSRDLRAPVAGPWMALADTGCPDENPDCSKVWVVVRAILIGVDGVGQAGGLAVMAEAALMPTSSFRVAPPPRSAGGQSRRTVQLRAVPYVAGRDAVGLGLVGRF
jgi:hypothetical protein